MAVRQDTRQRLLFANDESEHEWQSIDFTARQNKWFRRKEFGEWTHVIRNALTDAIRTQEQYSTSGWDRKCKTVIASLAKRRTDCVVRQLPKSSTWRQRCIAAKILLRAKLKRPQMNAWIRKCSTCALNHKRKNKERSKHTASSDQ
jgi:hypothetical protein